MRLLLRSSVALWRRGVPEKVVLRIFSPQNQIEYCRSKNCSAGNHPPRRNPGLRCTPTDAIWKKIKRKKEF
jgi:hypothetical protein